MAKIHITYRGTYEYLMKEYLEIREFGIGRKLKKTNYRMSFLMSAIEEGFHALDSLLNEENKRIIRIEKMIMLLHQGISLIYDCRIESMEGLD